MSQSSKVIYEKKVEGRLVRIEECEESGFKITTTQKEDDPGEVIQDGCGTTIISPTEAGREISWETASKEEISKSLIEEGFSESAVKEIVSNM